MDPVLLPNGQPLTIEGLAQVGESLLRLVAVSVQLGHSSPAHSLVYVAAPPDDDGTQQFVLDAFGACLVSPHVADAHGRRLNDYVTTSGLLDMIAEAVVQ